MGKVPCFGASEGFQAALLSSRPPQAWRAGSLAGPGLFTPLGCQALPWRPGPAPCPYPAGMRGPLSGAGCRLEHLPTTTTTCIPGLHLHQVWSGRALRLREMPWDCRKLRAP